MGHRFMVGGGLTFGGCDADLVLWPFHSRSGKYGPIPLNQHRVPLIPRVSGGPIGRTFSRYKGMEYPSIMPSLYELGVTL